MDRLHVLRANGIEWTQCHPQATLDHLGFVPGFVSEGDPRPAKEQIDARYVSGWHEFRGFELDTDTKALKYPGDPAYPMLYSAELHGEALYMYPDSWFAIEHADGTFSAARLD